MTVSNEPQCLFVIHAAIAPHQRCDLRSLFYRIRFFSTDFARVNEIPFCQPNRALPARLKRLRERASRHAPENSTGAASFGEMITRIPIRVLSNDFSAKS
jgi:hypothetical protein